MNSIAPSAGSRNAPPARHPARPSRTALAAIAAAATLGGCAWTAGYNAAYTNAARRPPAEVAEGKALVVTAKQDDAQVFSGNPTSFTGSATTLTMPLGEISREVARAGFTDAFKGGADWANEIKEPSAYVVIVAPRVVSFSYEYNQLKNVGFAITPTVRMTVSVQVLDDQGKARWEKTYPSGDVEGPSYMLNTSPHEEVNKLVHKALYDLYSASAREIVSSPDLVRRNSPPAPPAGGAAEPTR